MATLLTVPRELQIEILSYLSFEDHVCVTQTCRVLANILLFDNVFKKTRYTFHPETGDRYHRLLDCGGPADTTFGGVFCSARAGVIERYLWVRDHDKLKEDAFDRGYMESSSFRVADTIVEYADEVDGEEETDEGILVLRHACNHFFRFRVADITTSKFLDEPFHWPGPKSPPLSTPTRTRIHFFVSEQSMDVEGFDEKWTIEMEGPGTKSVRQLTTELLATVQSKAEEIGVPTTELSENIVGFQRATKQEDSEQWLLGVLQHGYSPLTRRFYWEPTKEGSIFNVWRSKDSKMRRMAAQASPNPLSAS
ncbi:hypothetical protein H072_10307 [Dactylellina haptotyla CBS 200.50]|uniref:F-box domain-containing protein n=1 Tax=Dactylellina haptotyla (strain CBS 200.50) TaxID=1284197 RepID=S7ZZK7_DACHA|nr:hypothetical protein H072_10307 [Dactylellina haptotyla CBS 200.50]